MHFADPTTTVLQMGLADGMKVGDLGAGAGHHALAAAGAVGPAGMVYAIDVQEDLLRRIKDAAQERRLRNVETIWGDFEKPGGTRLRDRVLDAVILSNTLFQLERREAAIAEMKRILAPSGRLLVADWAGSFGGIGPDESLLVAERDAEELFIQGGFHKVKSFKAGPHHYAILFTLP